MLERRSDVQKLLCIFDWKKMMKTKMMITTIMTTTVPDDELMLNRSFQIISFRKLHPGSFGKHCCLWNFPLFPPFGRLLSELRNVTDMMDISV